MAEPTVLIIPGLRDHVEEHWQTLLAARLPRVRCVPPMGRTNLDCTARVDAINRELMAISGPVVIVAHSGGVIMLAHWVASRHSHAQGDSRRIARDTTRLRATHA